MLASRLGMWQLKWELEVSGDKKMEPLKMALTNAFQKLDYESPELEAQLLIIFIDALLHLPCIYR